MARLTESNLRRIVRQEASRIIKESNGSGGMWHSGRDGIEFEGDRKLQSLWMNFTRAVEALSYHNRESYMDNERGEEATVADMAIHQVTLVLGE